jgi:hypothetical protein
MLEMSVLLTVIVATFVVLIWVGWVVARALMRHGTHLGRTAGVRKREADLAALNISPTDGGVLGDLSPVLATEHQIRRSVWRSRWLPWRRFAVWRAERAERRPLGVEFWKEEAQFWQAELSQRNAQYNHIRRENAFLRGDATADPGNGKLWPAAVKSRSRAS